MTIVYQLLAAGGALAFGGMMLSRNSYRSSARHWDYIASQLRTELNAGHDLLDRYAPTDAGAPLVRRIANLADRARRRSACLDCKAKAMSLAEQQADRAARSCPALVAQIILDGYAAGGQI